MTDVIERARQICIENPSPPGLPAQDIEQILDRVMAAAPRPEPIRMSAEPGLPFGLQRVLDPCLMARVFQHWDGRFILPLLQPCVWMFWIGVDPCWSGPRVRVR